MSLTAYTGRTLPSVFTDIPNPYVIQEKDRVIQEKETQLQESRKKIGHWAMRFILAIGALLVVIILAGLVFTWWRQATADKAVLQETVQRLEGDSEAYQSISELRDRVLTERRELLNVLAGTGRQPPLNENQRQAGWDAALSLRSCVDSSTEPRIRRCFYADRNANIETNGPSGYWNSYLMPAITEVLQDEMRAVARAEQNARAAQLALQPRPEPPAPRCNPITGECS